jgi:transposase-like protein
LISVVIFRYLNEVKCPRCRSGNVDEKWSYMGEYCCKHCGKYWKTI